MASGPINRQEHVQQLALVAAFTTTFAWFGLIAPASATDLDAPVERKITVKSEILRGYSASAECSRSDSLNYLDIIGCVNRIVSAETQNNTITDPFKFGIYHETYFDLWVSRKVMSAVMKIDPLNNHVFRTFYRYYYEQSETLKRSLGLSPDDVCRIDEAWGATKCQLPLYPPR